MKIIFLNIHFSSEKKELLRFIESHAESTDVFCFQEADKAACTNIMPVLGDFSLHRAEKRSIHVKYYQAIFVNKNYVIKNIKNVLAKDKSIGFGVSFLITSGSMKIDICTVHGVSQPGDKKDNPARIKQSGLLIREFSKIKGPRIIGGDFNLLPDTKSVELFEESGYQNLIKDFKIKTTRSKDAWERAVFNNKKYGTPLYEKQDYADYVFVSPGVNVLNFEVPQVLVSDHLPQILEFETKSES